MFILYVYFNSAQYSYIDAERTVQQVVLLALHEHVHLYNIVPHEQFIRPTAGIETSPVVERRQVFAHIHAAHPVTVGHVDRVLTGVTHVFRCTLTHAKDAVTIVLTRLRTS